MPSPQHPTSRQSHCPRMSQDPTDPTARQGETTHPRAISPPWAPPSAAFLSSAMGSELADLRAGQIDRATRRAAVTAELAAIVGQERRLLDAIADGDGTASVIRERLRDEMTRRDRLTGELVDLDAAGVEDTEMLLRTVTARAADLRGLLGRHVVQARQVVRPLVEGRLICQSFEDAESRGYTFTATGTYRRLGVPTAVNYGGGPNGIRTRVSATTTFSPRFSHACSTHRPSKSARSKHGGCIEAARPRWR